MKPSEVDMRTGDTVRVVQKVKEGDKTRLQTFEGLVIAQKHGHEIGGTFTVRKISAGIGVERIFPIASPFIEKIEINKVGKVRRARIFYFRDRRGKSARIQEKKQV